MTANDLRKRFPNATEQFIRINAHLLSDPPGDPAPDPIVERGMRDGALAAGKAKGRNSGRFFVRVTSYRRRLLDEDNLCEKYVVDCCRYAGILPGDDPSQARIVTTQEKVRSKEEERTEVVIERIEP